MDELRAGLEIALHGREADEWVRKARDQVSAWGLTLPEIEPLVIDFGLGDFPRIGEIEFWIANEVEAGYCGKFLFLFDGQTCPSHFHKSKLETFFVTRGALQMSYGSRRTTLSQGGVLRMETGVYHEFTAVGPSLILEVSRPSIITDNYFENSDIPIGGNFKGTSPESAP